MRIKLVLLLSLVLLLTACRQDNTALGTTETSTITEGVKDNIMVRKNTTGNDELLIGAWYAIDSNFIDKRHIDEIKLSGIDFAFAWYSTNAERDKILDLCDDAGVRCVLVDRNMMGTSTDSGQFGELTKSYISGKSFMGNVIYDEPLVNAYDDIAERCKSYYDLVPDKTPFVNLFPMYASDEQLGTPSYETYVEEYAKRVPTHYISVDIYPFDMADGNKTTYSGYMKNLDIVASTCRKYGMDLWVFIQTMGFNEVKCPPSLEDMRYQSYACLAFGAKTIMHFCYATPPSGGELFEYAMIDLKGDKTDLWYNTQRVNLELKSLSPVYIQYKNVGAFIHRAGPYVTSLGFDNIYKDFGTIKSIDCDESLLLGCFDKTEGEGSAFVVLNASELSRKASAKVAFELKDAKKVTAYIKGIPQQLTVKDSKYSIILESGEGAFICVD